MNCCAGKKHDRGCLCIPTAINENQISEEKFIRELIVGWIIKTAKLETLQK
jgi:hypothetical protein